MPALGMAQETGKLVRWIKSEGDTVTKGEALMEIETDKVTVEIESPANGTLAGVSAVEGEDIPVGRAIAFVVAAGEDVPAAVATTIPADSSVPEAVPAAATNGTSGRVASEPRRALASPK